MQISGSHTPARNNFMEIGGPAKNFERPNETRIDRRTCKRIGKRDEKEGAGGRGDAPAGNSLFSFIVPAEWTGILYPVSLFRRVFLLFRLRCDCNTKLVTRRRITN